MRYAIASLMLLFMMLPIQRAEASACYSPLEAEAEQGIRIHSELMVIGLNCQHMGASDSINLYSQYRQFTADHADLFAKYESLLMTHFRDSGVAKPKARLDTLRTKFANKISNDVASMRPDVFCSRYSPRITRAAEMNASDVRQWAATIYESHPVSKPVCGG